MPSVSRFECLLMRVFVCVYTQVCACVSAYAGDVPSCSRKCKESPF